MPLSRRDLIAEMGRACDLGNAAVFVGAGLSMPSGLPNWSDLLELPQRESNVPSMDETKADLPLLAEYILAEGCYDRDRLQRHMLSQITGGNLMPNQLHHLLTRLPVAQIWTTNYDPLIEIAADDSTVIAEDDEIREIGLTRRAIIKMHGSITKETPHRWASNPVITRSDYETYEQDRPRTWALLQAAYLSQTMLFLGFSFSDPNIGLLQRLSRLFGTDAGNRHLAVMRRPPEEEPERRRLSELLVRDLEAGGIRIHEIDEYGEIDAIMTALVRRTRPPHLFISGSAPDVAQHAGVCEALGTLLADKRGWDLVSLGGPSGWLSSKRAAELRRAEGNYDATKVRFYFRRKEGKPPAEFDERVGTAVFTHYEREPLVQQLLDECRALVVIGGGDRTREEIDWATARGLGIVPLPGADGTARMYWEERRSDPPDLGGQPTSPETWTRLGDTDVVVAARAAIELVEQAMYSSGAT